MAKTQMRTEPRPPFPEQKLDKPGIEAELRPRPRYQAPRYKPAGKLEGKVALVTGGDSGIGRAVAVLYAREGADVAASSSKTTFHTCTPARPSSPPGRSPAFRARPGSTTTRPPRAPLNAADEGQTPEKVANFGAGTPMKRPAQPEEIAPAYVFFASDADSSFMTGVVLPALGGETIGG